MQDLFQSSQGLSQPPRYDACRRSLQAQLVKNQMSINEVPPDSVSFNGLHTRLQEIQVLHRSGLTQEPVLSVLMVGLSPPSSSDRRRRRSGPSMPTSVPS